MNIIIGSVSALRPKADVDFKKERPSILLFQTASEVQELRTVPAVDWSAYAAAISMPHV